MRLQCLKHPPLFVDELLKGFELVAVLEILSAQLAKDVCEVSLFVDFAEPTNVLGIELEILFNKLAKKYLVGLNKSINASGDVLCDLVRPLAVLKLGWQAGQNVIKGLEMLCICAQEGLVLGVPLAHQGVKLFLALNEHSHSRLECTYDGRKVGHPGLQFLVFTLQLLVSAPVVLNFHGQLSVLFLQNGGLQGICHTPTPSIILNQYSPDYYPAFILRLSEPSACRLRSTIILLALRLLNFPAFFIIQIIIGLNILYTCIQCAIDSNALTLPFNTWEVLQNQIMMNRITSSHNVDDISDEITIQREQRQKDSREESEFS